jgi:phosphoribosylanthranilate isomerase
VAVEVKICGLTRAADAALATRHGASWLGVVFAESPRRLGLAAARGIVAAAEGVPVLGVFVDATPDEILRMRDRAGLSGAQLHGAYDTAARQRLRGEGLLIWAVARLEDEAGLATLGALAEASDVVLVEPHVPGVQGGGGVPLSEELARAARRCLAHTRLALAGGLRPGTLEAAIALVQPDIVDVSSGVEQAPGMKDARLLARFLEIARDADARA